MEVIKPNTISTTDGSFTRASSGTYVNSKGYLNTASTNVPRFNYNPSTLLYEGLIIEPAKTNLLTYSNNFDNAAWTKANLTRTIPHAENIVAPDGSLSSEKFIEGTGAPASPYFYIFQNKTVSVETTYTMSIYVKAAERTFCNLRLDDNSVNLANCMFNLTAGTFTTPTKSGTVVAATATITAYNNGWYRISLKCTWSIAPTTVSFKLQLANSTPLVNYTGDGLSGIYIWGAQLEAGTYGISSYVNSTDTFSSRASVGTYTNSSGLLATAITNTARYDYNPDDLTAPPFLLLEVASTNLLAYSEQFDQASFWGVTNTTIPLTNIVSPDGTANAEKLMETTAITSQHIIQQVITPVATTPYTFSVYVKAAERLYVLVGLSGGGMGDVYIGVNLLTGEITSTLGSPQYYSVSNASNGWWRISCTKTTTSTATMGARIWMTPDGTNSAYTGDGASSIYIYGAQLEATAYPTSYFLTTTASATRAADVSTSVAATRAADTITGSGLIYSTVTDPNAVYSAAITYALAAKVRYLSRVYESLQAINLNHTPSTSPTWWLDTGPDNIHAALDSAVSTVSSATTEMTFVVKAGKLDAVALITLDAPLASVAVTDQATGALLYNQTAGLSGSNVQDWYQYFFYDPITQRTQIIFDTIPDTYANAVVTIKLTGATGVAVSVAQAVFGITTQIGTTQYGASAGIIDYSKKETDTFGNTTFVVRAFSKRLSSEVFIPNLQLNSVQTYLYSIRATPVVWVASTDPLFSEPLIVWGFYKDFSTNISYPSYSVCSIEVEGLT
jgi:hypothetical protein